MAGFPNLVAHYDEEEQKEQLLTHHLLKVSRLSYIKGKEIGIGRLCELIGLLHDFGKCSEEFQLYIRGMYRGRVNHSSAGAKLLDIIEEKVWDSYDIEKLLKNRNLRLVVWTYYKEILQYPILAHHGLYDIIDGDFNYRTGIRLSFDKKAEKDYFDRFYSFFDMLNSEYQNQDSMCIYDLYYQGFLEFINIFAKIDALADKQKGQDKKSRIKRNKAKYFYYGTFVRLLLSILKDADIYDSSNYYREAEDKVYSKEETNDIWRDMNFKVGELYQGFNNKRDKTQLDIVRTNLADRIHKFSKNHSNGAFQLSMPVGSGKTYAALRYSIENAKKFQKSRIFYCTAFLSVLEQNASSIKEVIGKDHVLEHHSNIIEDLESGFEDKDDENEYRVNAYLKESWESPVILTTIVQLSNSMFQGRASNIRRFSKLVNSIVIIDEIQSLPIKTIYNFNLMTNFLVHIMGASIIHCTATQPNFHDENALDYPCYYGGDLKEPSIISSIENMKVFDRVHYYNLLGENLDKNLGTKELIAHIKDQLVEDMSALIVLNTKNAVSHLYNALLEDKKIIEEDWEIVYLTTNQCPKHRLDIIEAVKDRLKCLRNGSHKRKLICVSTKLVEAGVDIDFDIVYRSLTGIDSVIQCGGRCNREGKKTDKGRLFIFKYGDESLRYLPDLTKERRAAKAALRSLLREKPIKDKRIDIEKASDHYFRKLYYNEEEEGRQLEFPIDEGETILDILTTNPKGRRNYRTKYGKKPNFRLKQGFKTAAMNFELIKENTINVIVQYENSDLIDKLYELIDRGDYQSIKILLKQLQPYTIGIRRAQDYENHITRELDGMILILNQDAYDKKVGLTKGELQSLVF